MLKLTPIARQVLLACGGLAAAMLAADAAQAQQQQTQAQQQLERITVTGTNIRRTDAETVTPVQIITRDEIERTGKPTIAEVLRSVPGNTGGAFNESFANSFAPGAAGISLRGLGQKATLVLINGRRTAGYGFAQNLQDTFVDLNSIPSSAVERVEILKDGASAIYGSDAIAGVVNVILRRDFKGIEAGAEVGTFEGKKDYRANVVGGFGDLGANKFNVFGVLDFYKRDELLFSDTEFMKTRDFRGQQGGRNFQSLTAGGTWTGVPGSANSFERRAISECALWGGRVLNFAQAVDAGLISGPAALAAPGTGFNLPNNTWCAYDFNSKLSALPGTQRVGFLGRATYELSADTQVYAEVGLSRVETEQTFTPPFFAGTTGLTQTPQGLRPFTYNINFAPGVAGNPLGANARFSGNLHALGTRDNEITSDTIRALIGGKYRLFNWDLDSAIGYSENQVESMNINRITLGGTSAIFNVPSTPQPPVPLSTASACNLDAPSTTLAACGASLVSFPRKSTSKLEFIDTKGSTELGQLPGGPIGFAAGIEYRHESIADVPDPLAKSGQILGQGITETDGSRHQFAIFGELALPLTRTLEAQLALRNDRYSDFGNALTPKVGLKFKPTPAFLMRANWGRGFRAPTLPEISPSVATFFIQVNDPVTNTTPQASGIFAGNPDLKAETSRSATFGFVFEPTPNFNVSVDWYEINWSNIVGSTSFQSIVNGDAASRDPVTCTGGDPRVIRDPVTCTIVTILNNYRNLANVMTNGVDIDVRHDLRTTYGKFTSRLILAYINKFEEEGDDYAGSNGGSNTYPRIKGNFSLNWDRGPWGVTGRVNYIHQYRQELLAASFFAPQDPRFQTGTYPSKVPSYTTLDLFARYNVTPKLTVSGSILNVTDKLPPYDPGFSGTYLYDFSQYDVRGRQFRIGVQYKF
jgi:iron complex outermembrane receptor protein